MIIKTKTELMIIAISILLVISVSFILYKYNPSFTGLAILNDTVNEGNETIEEIEQATEGDALQAIEDAEYIIEEMQENNFPIIYVQDKLEQARKTLEQARYAAILRNSSSTDNERRQASVALYLIDWEKINYNSVIEITDEIKARKEQAFVIYDSINAAKLRIENYEGLDLSETENLIEEAEKAFYEDRYQDAENFLIQVRDKLEEKIGETATLAGLRAGAKNFFQRYWVYIILFLALASIVGFSSYKKIQKSLLRKKIKKMQAEKEVLFKLIKKSQIARFKENKISGLVYNIRMKKYRNRLQEIKEELPVLEERLLKQKKIRGKN